MATMRSAEKCRGSMRAVHLNGIKLSATCARCLYAHAIDSRNRVIILSCLAACHIRTLSADVQTQLKKTYLFRRCYNTIWSCLFATLTL